MNVLRDTVSSTGIVRGARMLPRVAGSPDESAVESGSTTIYYNYTPNPFALNTLITGEGFTLQDNEAYHHHLRGLFLS